MNEVLLDTHVWIWFCTERYNLISEKTLKLIENNRRRWISAISVWELCKLAEMKRIVFSIPLLDWINRSLVEYKIAIAHLEPSICVESCLLQNFHKDPVDQLIIATSRVLSIPLVSADKRIQQFSGVKVVW